MMKVAEASTPNRRGLISGGFTSLRVCIFATAFLVCGFGSVLIVEALSSVGDYPELKSALNVFSVAVALAVAAVVIALYLLNLAIGALAGGLEGVVAGRHVHKMAYAVWFATSVVGVLFMGALFVPAGGPLLLPMLAVLALAGSSAGVALHRWSQFLIASNG